MRRPLQGSKGVRNGLNGLNGLRGPEFLCTALLQRDAAAVAISPDTLQTCSYRHRSARTVLSRSMVNNKSPLLKLLFLPSRIFDN